MPQNHQNTKNHNPHNIGRTLTQRIGKHRNKVYEICFCHELTKRGLKYLRQIDIPIVYDGIIFQEGLRSDVKVLSDLFYKFSGISCFSGKKS